jgi:hypothetical protein
MSGFENSFVIVTKSKLLTLKKKSNGKIYVLIQRR